MIGRFAVEVVSSIDAIPAIAYDALAARCAAPAYYDRRFLRAAEGSPLLPCANTRYIVARDGDDLLGFLPVYQQAIGVADPFGLLAGTTSRAFSPTDTGLFSHVMHCSDTRILADPPSIDLYRALFERLASLARDDGIAHFAILNVADPVLIAAAREIGLEANAMVDRYTIDLSPTRDFEMLMARSMPKDGVYEMRRQRRKFEACDGRIVIEEPPLPDLEDVGRLCHETTARRGTPAYLPAADLARFIATCGDLVRLISIYSGERRLSVGILLVEKDVVHFWLAGMTYAPGMFSPYVMTLDALFRFAFAHGCRRIECGRLNARIKRRFGFSPVPLYSIINPEPLLREQGSAGTANVDFPAPDKASLVPAARAQELH